MTIWDEFAAKVPAWFTDWWFLRHPSFPSLSSVSLAAVVSPETGIRVDRIHKVDVYYSDTVLFFLHPLRGGDETCNSGSWIFIPKSLRDPTRINFWWVLFQMRLLAFWDGGESFARNNGFHFASNISNFIAFGLNLSLVEIFKVIQRPKFHWIWTKAHDTLGDVSHRNITLICTWKAMKFFNDLVCCIF